MPKQSLVEELLCVVEGLAMDGVSPLVLSDSGNLIVHLSPYPIVARVAKQWVGHSAKSWRGVMARELQVAQYLSSRGIPVVSCSQTIPSGPHRVGESWVTFWEYTPPMSLPALEPRQVVDMVTELSMALADFREPLPRLGVWDNVVEAADTLKLMVHQDTRIPSLLRAFEEVNETMQSTDDLFPAHGDAHMGNLLPSEGGWKWNDFEDVSLMPRFWDLASILGNTALFHGVDRPIVQFAVQRATDDKESLRFALAARAVMATTTNLTKVFIGNGDDGDFEFAHRQLAHVADFLEAIKHL